MKILPLHTLPELQAVEALQRIAWGASDLEIVPSHLLQAGAAHGACVLGGYLEKRLVGFTYAFSAGDYLYSHLAAVHPDFRGKGYGVALKRAQAAWARERGCPRVVWTFDPLQARNCRISLQILGATSCRYLVDYYGELEDDLNRGVPSDRLEVDWWLDERPRPKRRESFAYPWPLQGGQRLEWRLRLRAYLQDAFQRGLAVIDFEKDEGCRLWLG